MVPALQLASLSLCEKITELEAKLTISSNRAATQAVSEAQAQVSNDPGLEGCSGGPAAVGRVLEVSPLPAREEHSVRDTTVHTDHHGYRIEAVMAYEESWMTRRERCAEYPQVKLKRYMDITEDLNANLTIRESI